MNAAKNQCLCCWGNRNWSRPSSKPGGCEAAVPYFGPVSPSGWGQGKGPSLEGDPGGRWGGAKLEAGTTPRLPPPASPPQPPSGQQLPEEDGFLRLPALFLEPQEQMSGT